MIQNNSLSKVIRWGGFSKYISRAGSNISLVLVMRSTCNCTINRIGTSVCYWSVEFLGAAGIGNEADIYRDVRPDARGQGNKICIADQVALNVALISEQPAKNCCIEIAKAFIGSLHLHSGPWRRQNRYRFDCSAPWWIAANNHKFVSVQKIREQGVTRKGIVIEDDCWLGMGQSTGWSDDWSGK